MADYTVVNLKEVEDAAPKFGLAPGVEARFAGPSLGLAHSGLSYQRLEPGFRVPFGHRHAEQEEIYIVLGGSAWIKLDDEIVELGPWDTVRVSNETMRGFEAGPDGVELLAFGAPKSGVAGSDAEIVQGWWTD